jgi:hypothetical protein
MLLCSCALSLRVLLSFALVCVLRLPYSEFDCIHCARP